MPSIVIRSKTEHAVELGPERGDAGAARRFTRRILWAWGLTPLSDDAENITAELIANAIPGGRYRLTLTIDLADRVVRIEVRDNRTGVPMERHADDYAEDGRGLLIVDTLADDWGYTHRRDGNTVWAELTISTAAR